MITFDEKTNVLGFRPSNPGKMAFYPGVYGIINANGNLERNSMSALPGNGSKKDLVRDFPRDIAPMDNLPERLALFVKQGRIIYQAIGDSSILARKVRFTASDGLFKVHALRKYDGTDRTLYHDPRAHYESGDYEPSEGYSHTFWTTEAEFTDLQEEYGTANLLRL